MSEVVLMVVVTEVVVVAVAAAATAESACAQSCSVADSGLVRLRTSLSLKLKASDMYGINPFHYNTPSELRGSPCQIICPPGLILGGVRARPDAVSAEGS